MAMFPFRIVTGFSFFGIFIVVIFMAMFGLVIGLVVRTLYVAFTPRRFSDASPVLIVPAAIVSKRSYVSGAGHTHYGDQYHTGGARTDYFVTFEVESGDRIELLVDAPHYGLMAEDDVGKLTFQGRRFIAFERNRNMN